MGLVSFLITSCVNKVGALARQMWMFRDSIPNTKTAPINIIGTDCNKCRIVQNQQLLKELYGNM